MPESRFQGLVHLRDDDEEAGDSKATSPPTTTTTFELSQVNARVPVELHKRLKLFSVEHDQEIKDIVAKAISAYLDEHG